MTRHRKILVDDLDRIDHTPTRKRRNTSRLSAALEAKFAEMDEAIAELVKATANDYFAARERQLPNPFDSLGNLLGGK